MNTYICFYKGKKIEVKAESSLEAQTKAAKEFKAKKRYEVTPMLVAIDDTQVVHNTGF